jgi:hypothetical protein
MRIHVSVVALLAGCSPAVNDQPCDRAVPLHELQAQVFDHCGGDAYGPGCHVRDPLGAGLNLRVGKSWDYLVNYPSVSSPAKFRVLPKDVQNSFLWQKLNNELASDGSEGVPMPRDPSDHWAPLGADQLTAVRCWIATGALDD